MILDKTDTQSTFDNYPEACSFQDEMESIGMKATITTLNVWSRTEKIEYMVSVWDSQESPIKRIRRL